WPSPVARRLAGGRGGFFSSALILGLVLGRFACPQVHPQAFENRRELALGGVDQAFATDEGGGALLNFLAAHVALLRCEGAAAVDNYAPAVGNGCIETDG